jgi:hypothetical protein
MGNQASRIPEGFSPCLLIRILISTKATQILLHPDLPTISSGRWGKMARRREH